MDHVEYVYTSGMTESELDSYLRTGEHGVLALATENDAYAVPLSYHFDGDIFLIRVSGDGDASDKGRFLETTRTASFVCYQSSENESWSILIRGSLQEWERDVAEASLNDWFQPFRLFDEAVESVEFSLYELEMESVVGRKTVD